jgi:hypothetical protein
MWKTRYFVPFPKVTVQVKFFNCSFIKHLAIGIGATKKQNQVENQQQTDSLHSDLF